MLRLIGRQEYGIYSLASSVIGYLGIMNFGLGNTAVRYSARYRALNDQQSQEKLNALILVIYSSLGVAASLIGSVLIANFGLFFSKTISPEVVSEAKQIAVLVLINLVISFPLGIFSSVIIANERFTFSKGVILLQTILKPLAVIPMLFWGHKAIAIAAVETALSLVVSIANILFCIVKLHIKFCFKGIDWSLLKEMSVYTFYIFLGIIFDRIFWNTDQVILGAMYGTSAVAVYSLGSSFSLYYVTVADSLTGVLLPRITSMVAKGYSMRKISHLFIRVGRIQFMILSLIMSGFILFGKRFISLWAGSGYEQAYFITMMLIIPLTVTTVQSAGLSILQAKAKQGFRNTVYLIAAGVNIILSILLGRIWEGFGCALASAVVLVLGSVVIMNIYYHRVIHINIPVFWREIAKLSVPVALAAAVGVLIALFIHLGGWGGLAIECILYSAVYIPLVWIFGADSNEKNRILSSAVVRPFQKALRAAESVLSLCSKYSFSRLIWLNTRSNIYSQGGRLLPERHTVVDLDPAATCRLRGNLHLNSNRPRKSHTESLLKLEKGAKLTVNGSFTIYYGCDIAVFEGAQLVLGSGYINAGSQIQCAKRITIGEGSAIARGVVILDSDHHVLKAGGRRLNRPAPVRIGSHVWIGTGAKILKGVTIGDGAVISAGAVVTEDVPPGCVVAGVPAKVIRREITWS